MSLLTRVMQEHEKVVLDHWMHRLIYLKARTQDVVAKADKALVR